ncbi:hypothetical protein SS50377_23755 [Spironucleus salmonicida]|uniref:Uncharacterized protein n=1 Tax=Spironucleus salmonicida TaxID=348837 RepID=V6LZZ5_9EUKA|nr:hypothetical protein SS50377_23755 [Spironucleus salmonicida]|eukprot:EST46434.1 hypothetical protein SS50377_13519 [Spironucleus salmonicida]
MTKRLLLGDNTDFHMCSLQNGIFSVGDNKISQLIKKQIINDVQESVENIIYFDNDYMVTDKKVIKNQETILEVESLITSYAPGYAGTSDGQIFFNDSIIHKLSDVVFSILSQGNLLLVVSINGEIVLMENNKVIQQTKFASKTRGQLPWSILPPMCGFLSPYLVTPCGIRQVTDIKQIVTQLNYQFTRAFTSNKFIGVTNQLIEVCQLINSDIKIIGKLALEHKNLIDAYAVDKGEHCLIYCVYEDLDDGFKYAEFYQISLDIVKSIPEEIQHQKQKFSESKIQTPKSPKQEIILTINKTEEKLDYLDDSDDFKSQQSAQKQKSEKLFVDDIQDASMCSNQSNDSLQSDIIVSSKVQSVLTTCNSQFYAIQPGDTQTYFSSLAQRSKAIKSSSRTIFQLNQFGQISGQNQGHSFQLSVIPADVNYQPRSFQFPNIVVSAFLAAEGFAILTEHAFQMHSYADAQPLYKGVLPSYQSPDLVALVDLSTTCITLEGRNCSYLHILSGGMCLSAQTYGRITHLTANSQMIFFIEDGKRFHAFDPFSLTAVYQCQLGLNTINFLSCTEDFVVLGDVQGLYIVDFQDLFGQNSVSVTMVHSYLEAEYARIQRMQDRLLKIINGQVKDALTRGDLNELRSTYFHPVYIEQVGQSFQIQAIKIEQDDSVLLGSFNALMKIADNQKAQKVDFAAKFDQDLRYLKQHFPVIYEPSVPLLQTPTMVALAPSPPINSNQDEIDALERKIFIEFALLRSRYVFQFQESQLNRCDMEFDLQLLGLGQLLCKAKLASRVQALCNLFRTRRGLEGFRAVCLSSGSSEAAKLCLDIIEGRFQETENFARDGDILPGARPSGGGITGRKLDVLGFSFASGGAKQKFQEVVKDVRFEVDELIKRVEKDAKSGAYNRKASAVPSTPQNVQFAPDASQMGRISPQNYENLPPADPQGNRKFLSSLGHAPKKVALEPKAKTPQMKLSAASGTPQKNQLSLGDALGGN